MRVVQLLLFLTHTHTHTHSNELYVRLFLLVCSLCPRTAFRAHLFHCSSSLSLSILGSAVPIRIHSGTHQKCKLKCEGARISTVRTSNSPKKSPTVWWSMKVCMVSMNVNWIIYWKGTRANIWPQIDAQTNLFHNGLLLMFEKLEICSPSSGKWSSGVALNSKIDQIRLSISPSLFSYSPVMNTRMHVHVVVGTSFLWFPQHEIWATDGLAYPP